ncbi:RNA polymerase sigma-70 factor [Dysgonomonas sp. Marseille-P4677]|uniref:RNA polymerase sigma-70 factor n=1 Tax=Dysgonomonas sp. Marseille-P4677 TaxID=2364790 RepID=UPI001911B4BB|nr:RNA polymerase sigma-70 factor [Dysgonomonas sp. Marseille-P4677]MBK5720732.1 RNA polymerase sigma-70 factor [Dysgonomonas sp. Marseille-P4677]
MDKQFDHTKVLIDEATLKEFFNAYFDDICTFLNYYTHNKQLIEDIIQDIFIKLWEERDTVNIFFIKTYLYNAARNRMLNHLRNEQNRSALLDEWANREIEKQKAKDCVNMEEFSLIYQQAINDLPEKCREIFILSKEYSKTYREIAETKNLSIKTVEAQMSIAIKRVRDYILKYYSRPNSALPLITVLIATQGYLFFD